MLADSRVQCCAEGTPMGSSGNGGVIGPSSGVLPNIYFRSVTMEAVRDHPSFEALPPVDQVALVDPQCYRFVRQDSALWRALHAGVLTSGTLNGALGFNEPTGVARLGLPRNFISHRPLLCAYENLRLPQHRPLRAALPIEEAAEFNEAAMAAYNSRSLQRRVAEGAAPHRERLNCSRGSRKKGGGGQRPRDSAATAVWAAREDAILRTARRLSSAGLSSVRMAWGSAQEPASVLDLVSLFPDASVKEVGLCMVRQDAIPTEWGFPPGSLPPIGASPDAMLHHPPVPSSLPTAVSAAMQAVTPAVVSALPPQLNPANALHAHSPAVTASPPTDPLPEVVAEQKRQKREITQQRGKKLSVTSSGATSAAVEAATSTGPRSSVLSDNIEQLLQELQLQQARGPQTGAPESPASRPSLLPDGIEQLLQKLQMQQARVQETAPVPQPCQTSPGSLLQSNLGQQPHLQHTRHGGDPRSTPPAHGLVEMVEVKNTSPFSTATGGRLSKKGKPRAHYAVFDKGPRTQVPCYWVPQLQMEMLASDTHSIILLTRSATKGSNLFRMYRDDIFLHLMLQRIASLQADYVVPGIQPGLDAFCGDEVYNQLLSRTLKVVAGTPCLRHIPCGEQPTHVDASVGRLFL